MAAGIAHELNRPVGTSLASTLQRKAEQFAVESAGGDLRRSILKEFV
jgi:hypothetical protein